MTQDELGDAVGVTGNAIRNYEHDYRSPNAEQLDKIAEALEISASALDDYRVETAREALEALFRLEDAFGLAPGSDGTLKVNSHARGAQKLVQAIKVWDNMKRDVAEGKMSEEYYDLWKASFMTETD